MCAMVRVLRVVVVSMRSGRLGLERPIISEDMLCVEHGEIAGGEVQGDGFNNNLVQKEQVLGFD